MKNRFGAIEMSLLRFADETGRIKLPDGSGEEIERALKVLLRLERAGYVVRVKGTAYYRAFTLTDAGQATIANDAGKMNERESSPV